MTTNHNMEELEESNESVLQRRISILVTILLILAVLVCIYVVIQVMSNGYVNIGGFMMFRVVTGSMEPTIPVGALLMTRQVDIGSIQMDDIICFRTQEAAIWGKIVTHRVVGIAADVSGGVLLETKGDANLVMDGYLVSGDNFIGKVIWHTGDGSIVANILSLFTNKIGFLGCIVFPCLILAGLILRECVSNIRTELQAALEEMERLEKQSNWELDPLCGMTQEEYHEMYERIRAELIEELMQCAEILEEEQKRLILEEQRSKTAE